MLALLPHGTPLHPWALALAPGAPLPSDGAEVACDLTAAERPSLRIAIRPAAFAPEALSLLAARAAEAPRDDEDARVRARLDTALAAFAGGGAPAALADLIGLGPGLTPSGDDVVLGALAALDLARAARPSAHAAHAALRDAVRAALAPGTPEPTPALSAQLLRAAADGLHAEPLLSALDALAAGDARALGEALDALLGVGHHSGRDLLRGVAAALLPPARGGASARH